MSRSFSTFKSADQLDTTGWCPDHAICMDWIDRRAVELIENFQPVDTVYMSNDIYTQFLKTMAQNMRGPHVPNMGLEIVQIITTAGTLTVKRVPYFTNFCYVGTDMTYAQLEQAKLDQDFEDTVMKDFDRV